MTILLLWTTTRMFLPTPHQRRRLWQLPVLFPWLNVEIINRTLPLGLMQH
jgi:hypothetical protein